MSVINKNYFKNIRTGQNIPNWENDMTGILHVSFNVMKIYYFTLLLWTKKITAGSVYILWNSIENSYQLIWVKYRQQLIG